MVTRELPGIEMSSDPEGLWDYIVSDMGFGELGVAANSVGDSPIVIKRCYSRNPKSGHLFM